MGKTFGIAALILGIISIPFNAVVAIMLFYDVASISILGWIIPIVAIVLGVIGIIVDDTKGWAIAGIIFGIIGLVTGFFIRSLVADFLASLP